MLIERSLTPNKMRVDIFLENGFKKRLSAPNKMHVDIFLEKDLTERVSALKTIAELLKDVSIINTSIIIAKNLTLIG